MPWQVLTFDISLDEMHGKIVFQIKPWKKTLICQAHFYVLFCIAQSFLHRELIFSHFIIM